LELPLCSRHLARQNVHWPLEAPDAYVQRFAATTGNDTRRQHVAAMANIADEGIGNVTSALKRRGLWDSTHLVLLSDNGGPTNGNEGTWSSNFPMRNARGEGTHPSQSAHDTPRLSSCRHRVLRATAAWPRVRVRAV
jgi:arylsulfatase A-like enzyme